MVRVAQWPCVIIINVRLRLLWLCIDAGEHYSGQCVTFETHRELSPNSALGNSYTIYIYHVDDQYQCQLASPPSKLTYLVCLVWLAAAYLAVLAAVCSSVWLSVSLHSWLLGSWALRL
jgi:hypothetical protein